MTAARDNGSPEATLNDDWRRWIAENLMLNTARGKVVDILIEAGFSPQIADREVGQAEKHPYVLGSNRLQARLAKQDWLTATLASLEEIGPSTVERRDTIAETEFFDRFYARNEPLVLTNVVADWRAMSMWSLDYLEHAVPETTVQVQLGRDSSAEYEQQSNNFKKLIPWSDFIGALRCGRWSNDYYLTANNGEANCEKLAPLWRDFGKVGEILRGNPEHEGFLWLGPAGTITPWHHDLTNNILVQIMGRKRITLASPSQTPRMRNHHHCYSAFGLDPICAAAPPLARPWLRTYDLAPGELIFLPLGWWHHVQALEVSASVTFTNFNAPNNFHESYSTRCDF